MFFGFWQPNLSLKLELGAIGVLLAFLAVHLLRPSIVEKKTPVLGAAQPDGLIWGQH